MSTHSKKLFYTLLLCFGTLLHAEWDSISLQKHINDATIIVIAEFQKELKKKESDFGTTQLVSFKIHKNIKGKISGLVSVEGQALEMCMPQMLFDNIPKTNYLLFLVKNKKGKDYALVHGQRSALRIQKDTLGWIKSNVEIDRGIPVPTHIDKVLAEIKGMI